jgi:UDP-N-acetylmuramoylalanine--D-glutamate ligase
MELAKISDLAHTAGSGDAPVAPHVVANALAAAALARSYGVSVQAVRDGLRGVRLGGHKIETVLEQDGIRWVDDSKATNPHAADAALRAFESTPDRKIVWIAGGQAKGTTFDQLVLDHRSRLRGAVLLGVDRDIIGQALRRHAPEVPTEVIESAETSGVAPAGDGGAMARAVAAAASLAQPGDVVLLAPACASKDMYADYAARGDAFAVAVLAQASKE